MTQLLPVEKTGASERPPPAVRGVFVAVAAVAATLLATTATLPTPAGAAQTTPAACHLLTPAQAAALLGAAKVNEIGPANSACLYTATLSTAAGPTGSSTQPPTIQLYTSRNAKTLRTVRTLLSHKPLHVIAPRSSTAPSTTRHFVTVDRVPAVYTLQGNPATVVETTTGVLPQAALSTIVHGTVVQVVVTGHVQPQRVTQKALDDALKGHTLG
jgi:hypothetical protein